VRFDRNPGENNWGSPGEMGLTFAHMNSPRVDDVTIPSVKRRLFNLFTALSLLLCMAATAEWVRSYWRSDLIHYDKITSIRPGVEDRTLKRWYSFGVVKDAGNTWAFTGVFFPQFALPVVFAILPGIRIGGLIKRRRRHGPHDCECCGYDLRASPERCPECGMDRAQNQKTI
jgi:hypothetical protein